MPLEIIHALVRIKRAAARTNAELGLLPPAIADAIVKAATQIIEGSLDDHFPLTIWQTGSGTQSNMNVNEVIANLANVASGKPLGSKAPVHPNDHVNMGQSSNDTFPTAMHVSASLAIHQRLLPTLQKMIKTLEQKSAAFAHITKIGRTHLQDATPLTLGQEFSGYAAQMHLALESITRALNTLMPLAQGGTAVGTGLNTHREFGARVANHLAKETNLPFTTAQNKFEALAAHDSFVEVHGTLARLASGLFKIASDIRLLGSGPRAGFAELILPANEPGSSIMPGKVNPTQAEALTMIAIEVMGNQSAVTFAASQGHLELNVFKPLIISNTLRSINLLSDGMAAFDAYCLQGLAANPEQIRQHLERSLMLVTALAPLIGYDVAAKIAKNAYEQGLTLKEAALRSGAVDEATYDRIVIADNMTGG